MSTALQTIAQPGAIAEVVGAEIDKQIETAKRHPRDMKVAREELRAMATSTEDIASACLYSLERKEKGGGKKFIVGPSIRFAELLVYSWGNIRWGARVLEEGREFVTVQGFCADLQRNTGVALEVKRRITTSDGHRFGTDMIGVTIAAASSIAMRNAVFDTIPEALWRDVWEAARVKAVGDQKTLKTRVDRAIEFFVKAGADEAMIYPALGVSKRSEITLDHLAVLRGLHTAVRENAISIDRLFHPDAAAERAQLSLVADEDQFGTIDRQLQGAKKGGAEPKADAAKVEGAMEADAEPKGKAKKAKADSGAKQTVDAKVDETDADLISRVEAEHASASSIGKARPIAAAQAALERIAKGGDEKLAFRADRLLNLYDLEQPGE